MALMTLVSVTGAPGVTTCAVGLALAWPRDVVLVDADRSASQAIVAGYWGNRDTGGRGLTALAQIYRDGHSLASDLMSHCLALPAAGNQSFQRWFLPGFARPGSANLFEPIWPELAASLDGLGRQGIDVIVDAGRWGCLGLPASLLKHSRCLCIVTRSNLRALAGLQPYLSDIKSATAGLIGCVVGMIIVGPSDPYGSQEIAQQFTLPIHGELPWQADDAFKLSHGGNGKSNHRLGRALATTAIHLHSQAEQWAAKVGRYSTTGGAT